MPSVSIVAVVHDGVGVRHERCVISDTHPILIGRGWHCDIILQDPLVDSEHAELRIDDAGELVCVDLGSLNGAEVLVKSSGKVRRSKANPSALKHGEPQTVTSGSTLRLGRSRLAVYRTDHEVTPATVPSRWDALRQTLEQPRWALLSVALFLVAAVLVRLTQTVEPLTVEMVVSQSSWLTIGCGLWVLFWGLLSKLLRDAMHLRAHLSIAAFSGVAAYLVTQLGRFVGWQIQSVDMAAFIVTVGEAVLLFVVLVLSLGVATRLRRSSIIWLSCVPGILLLLSIYVLPRLGEETVEWFPNLITSSYPPSWQIAEGETLDTFLDASPSLYEQSAQRAEKRAVELAEE